MWSPIFHVWTSTDRDSSGASLFIAAQLRTGPACLSQDPSSDDRIWVTPHWGEKACSLHQPVVPKVGYWPRGDLSRGPQKLVYKTSILKKKKNIVYEEKSIGINRDKIYCFKSEFLYLIFLYPGKIHYKNTLVKTSSSAQKYHLNTLQLQKIVIVNILHL